MSLNTSRKPVSVSQLLRGKVNATKTASQGEYVSHPRIVLESIQNLPMNRYGRPFPSRTVKNLNSTYVIEST